MPRQPKRRGPKQILARYATITEWQTSLSVRVDRQRGMLPARAALHCIEFRGRLEEPVKDVSELSGTVFSRDDVSMSPTVEPHIGVILAIKPAVNAVVTFTPQEFSWLLTLVAGNQLGACYLSFGEPVRGKAFIYSLSFDKTLPPAEEG